MFSVHCTPRVSRLHGKTHGCQHGKTHGTKSEYDCMGNPMDISMAKAMELQILFSDASGRQHQNKYLPRYF